MHGEHTRHRAAEISDRGEREIDLADEEHEHRRHAQPQNWNSGYLTGEVVQVLG